MHPLSIRNLTIFLIPTGLLGATAWLFPRLSQLPPGRLELIPIIPYLAMALGMILSIHFHRGRAFFIFLILSAAYWGLRLHPTGEPGGIRGTVLYQSISILVPLNITIFSLMRERGIVTLAGRLRFAFLGLQMLFIWWIIEPGHVAIQQLLSLSFTNNHFVTGLILPQLSLPLFAIGTITAGWRASMGQSPIDASLLGVMWAFAVASNGIGKELVTPVFMTAAAAVLTVGVLRDSYNMAFRDDLTGLPSRRALNEQLTWLGRRYAIAMVDVDHFKRFNDTYGHDVGDQVLRMVASKLRGVGCGGKVYRYGGEEFTILFPRKGREEVLGTLEELRRTIAEYRLRLRASDRPTSSREGRKMRRGTGESRETVSVTVSIGVAESGGQLRRPVDVMKAADQALYRAKGGGRNRICT